MNLLTAPTHIRSMGARVARALLSALLALGLGTATWLSTPAQALSVVTTVKLSFGSHPQSVGVNPNTNRVYIASNEDDSVRVIDGTTDSLTDSVWVRARQRAVAVNPTNNRVFVAGYGTSSVWVIDGNTDAVIATLGVAGDAFGLGVNPNTNRVYVAIPVSNLNLNNDVSVIDGTSNVVTGTVRVGGGPVAVGVNPTTNRIYVANYGDGRANGSVSVIDGNTNGVVATVGVGMAPYGVGVDPTTNRIYVANSGSNAVSVIDGSTNAVIATVGVGGDPRDVAVDPTAHRVYVANNGSDSVSVLDGSTNAVVATVGVGDGPQGVGVNTTTHRIYAANHGADSGSSNLSDSVSVIADTTPPTTDPTQSPVADAAGWNNADVAVTWNWADDPAGVGTDPANCTTSSISSGEGVLALNATCNDLAGNTGVVSYTVKVDKTAPTLSGTPMTSPNGNGWYRNDVGIGWSCSDTLSGIRGSCPANSLITGEGAELRAGASVSDSAGNTTTAASSPAVSIDRTPPTTLANAPSGWTNGSVSVTLTPSDSLSGVQATYYTVDGGSQQTYQPGSPLSVTAEGTHTLQYWSVDRAGNSETTHTAQIKIDKTAPTITNTNSPASNTNGWNNAPVTVTFTCTDALSGLASCNGTTPSTPTTSMIVSSPPLQTEGLGQLVSGSAVDNAGTAATDPVVVNIDETPPTITGSRFPEPNAAGWNNGPVNVSFTCTDPSNASNATPGSGVATCAAPAVLSAEGTRQSVRGTAADGAGNTASATVSGINIDATPPTITYSGQTPAAPAGGTMDQ